jgi:hypothetical protein
MRVLRLAHVTGVNVRPRFVMNRLLRLLVLLRSTLRYGLSISKFDASVVSRRRVPAAVR